MLTCVIDLPDDEARPRARNAAATRAALLDVAMRRFAADGYSATTVREISDDVGVNVALISRYFGSKEGVYEACLEQARGSLLELAGVWVGEGAEGSPDGLVPEPSMDLAVQAITRLIAHAGRAGQVQPAILLVLRSSGEAATERMRIELVSRFATLLASTVPDQSPAGHDERLFRAQFVLGCMAGLLSVGAPGGLEPLSGASEDQLRGPIGDLVHAVLIPR